MRSSRKKREKREKQREKQREKKKYVRTQTHSAVCVAMQHTEPKHYLFKLEKLETRQHSSLNNRQHQQQTTTDNNRQQQTTDNNRQHVSPTA